ncbi:MAG: glycosyltransferase family 2 protein [Bacillota bacterium]
MFCVIVPAFNEEKTVGAVVRAAWAAPGVCEVVVVDDGSEDRTSAVARAAGAKVLRLSRNMGKGAAMMHGVRNTHGDPVVFLDADLIGLEPHHVSALAEPVINGEAEMTLGVFERGRAATDLAQTIAPFLSGQRAVRRELLCQLSEIEITRFGVEIALTRYARAAGLKVVEVPLKGVSHLMKEEKMGFAKGLQARLKMYLDILKTVQKG